MFYCSIVLFLFMVVVMYLIFIVSLCHFNCWLHSLNLILSYYVPTLPLYTNSSLRPSGSTTASPVWGRRRKWWNLKLDWKSHRPEQLSVTNPVPSMDHVPGTVYRCPYMVFTGVRPDPPLRSSSEMMELETRSPIDQNNLQWPILCRRWTMCLEQSTGVNSLPIIVNYCFY